MGKGEGTPGAIGARGLRALVVLVVLFFTLSAGAAAQAATIRVNTTKDLATSASGKCSLRLAIATVNSPGTKTACGVADHIQDLIVLGPNTYKLTIPRPKTGSDDNSVGDLNLTSTVPMLQMVGSGPGATLIQGSSKLNDRLLTISKKSSLVLSGMTMLGGHAPDGAAGSGACPLGVGGNGQDGGAILNQGGSLFLFLVTLSGNHAGNGGAGAPGTAALGCNGGNGGSGGGIYNEGGYVNVTSSTISGNHAGAGGNGGAGASGPVGGLGGNGGAGGSGGGIASAGGNVVIGGTTVLGAGDTIASNHAGAGGDGGNGGDSTTGNTNGGNGGAGGQGGDGGGLSTTNAGSKAGSLGVTNSTLTANVSGAGGTGGTGGSGSGSGTQGSGGAGGAGGSGGAIAGDSSPSRMGSTTIASNSSAAGGNGGSPGGKAGAAGVGGGVYANSSASTTDMTLQNTLVASNTTLNCAAKARPVVNGGYDLSYGDKTCPAVTNGDPKLKKLSDYGGFTYSMALEPGSAAINRGPPKGAGCPARDQRAVRRPQGKACDIGAFEFAVPTVTIYTPRNGARYKRGSRVVADFRCTEGGSSTTPITPLASCNGTVFTGSRINTRTLGRKTFKVTARDLAGNKTVKTIHYTVVKKR